MGNCTSTECSTLNVHNNEKPNKLKKRALFVATHYFASSFLDYVTLLNKEILNPTIFNLQTKIYQDCIIFFDIEKNAFLENNSVSTPEWNEFQDFISYKDNRNEIIWIADAISKYGDEAWKNINEQMQFILNTDDSLLLDTEIWNYMQRNMSIRSETNDWCTWHKNKKECDCWDVNISDTSLTKVNYENDSSVSKLDSMEIDIQQMENLIHNIDMENYKSLQLLFYKSFGKYVVPMVQIDFCEYQKANS